MTIKRNGSRVVLKNGKVSCTCCAQGGCCMYPAQALADGLYTVDDLPDEVFGAEDSITSGLITKLDPPTVFPDGAIQYYNNPESGGIYLLPDVGLWTGEGDAERPCLISFFIEDQFADTYTISGGSSSFTVAVTRISLCIWRGADACGNLAYLVYGDDTSLPFGGTDYKWSVALPFYNTVLDCESFQGRTVSGKENQNTPAGVYETFPGQPLPQTITVS